MYFKGDIIVTDPCYLLTDDDYDFTKCGRLLNRAGFKTYLIDRTGYGDWSNTILGPNNEELEFGADSGQVCVVLKSEYDEYVKQNNIKPINFECKDVALLKDFEGDIILDTSCSSWTVVRGSGNYTFCSEEPSEYALEEEKRWKRLQEEQEARFKESKEYFENLAKERGTTLEETSPIDLVLQTLDNYLENK